MTRSSPAPQPAGPRPAQHARGSAGEVFRAFLKLGLTSFGGPIAHSLKGLQAEQVSTSQELPLRQ